MIANYHTHTRWCRHGVGEIKDFVDFAFRAGLEEIAITEHVPLPGNPDKKDRMQFEEFPLYDADFNQVIDEYKGKIRIRKGFECEYYPHMLETYRMYKEQYGYEIFILGQHVDIRRTFDNFHLSEPWQLALYADNLCEGLETGFFDFLCHPDLVMIGYRKVDNAMLDAMDRIFAACGRLKIPVEINAAGIKHSYGYPDREVWQLARGYELSCVVNSDAHKVEELTGEHITRAEEFAAEFGLKHIKKLD